MISCSVCLKNVILVSMFRRYVACEKCVQYLFMNILLPLELIDTGHAASLLKGRGSGETHATQIQETDSQYNRLLSELSLAKSA